jgi:5-methyltetrahydropteroyltriglutamate--homocysteine methyltransferase
MDFVRLQEDLGFDLVTNGELRRDNFYSFVADKFDNVRLMTLAELLDAVEDRAGFERLPWNRRPRSAARSSVR